MICTQKKTKVIRDSKECQPLVGTPYEFNIYDSITEFEELWASKESQFNLFLSIQYFKALEATPLSDLQQRYVLLWENGTLVAMFPMQLKLFQAQESILDADNEDSSHIRKSLVKRVRFNTLICGNITVSGELMHCYLKEGLTPKEQFVLTEKVIDSYREHLNNNGYRVNMSFMKDVPSQHTMQSLDIQSSSFKDFNVEPLMVLYMDKNWRDMNDYLSSMSSKYRVRAKRAFKKSKGIQYRELNLEEIRAIKEDCYPLYKNVMSNINFSLFELPIDYFAIMKEYLGDAFRFYIAEEEETGQLVAFYSMIHNGPELHAHYLGYDKSANKKYQLYLNLLYRMVELGLDHEHEWIDYGRTALEIKSSVGAKAYEYSLYLKHKNPLANFFVPSLISILNRKTIWTPRSPFK